MDIYEQSLALHKQHQGKYCIQSKVALNDFTDLGLAYSPGVAAPCNAIAQNQQEVYTYTSKGSTIAVISDGSAVLGLGNIGPYAGLPVMEGKAILFKAFADVNAIPLCLATQDTDEIIRTCEILEPSIGGINLEDISAPRCFIIEAALKAKLNIPVFHDDQHGTAIVVAAALINANRLSGKSITSLKVVINGIGAAGVAIARMLHKLGVVHITALNSKGVINQHNAPNSVIEQLLHDGIIVNELTKSSLEQVMIESNVFIGVSVANLVTSDMVRSMASDPYIFALANPQPEIMPDLAKEAGAFVVGTGRSDFPNQINNVLAFPGIFHGVLSARASQITDDMQIASAKALAHLVSDSELNPNHIIPDVFDERVVPAISKAITNLVQSPAQLRK